LDEEVGKAFQATLKKQGMKFLLNSKVVDGVNNKDKGVKINVENSTDNTKLTLDCDIALISIGRHAFTGGL